MFRSFLALRYMVARPISYLAAIAIAVAVGALITVASIMNGFLDETRSVIRGTTADLIVFPGQSPEYGMVAPAAELLEVVTAQTGVEGACARLVRPAVFRVADAPAANLFLGNSMHAELNMLLVLGIDADAERDVTGLDRYLRDVEEDLAVADPERPLRLPRSDIRDPSRRTADLPTVLVGASLMRSLGLERGDGIHFVTVPDGSSLEGTIRTSSELFLVAGAFSTGHEQFDQGNVFVARDRFREWSGTSQDVSELYVRAAPGTDLGVLRDEVSVALQQRGHRAIVETWMDRHHVLLGAVENERNILFFVLGLFVLLTCTITFSMLTMMVREKIRDIGILSAMGAPPSGIGAVFALCGLLVAGSGGLLGFVFGEMFARNLNPVKDAIEAVFDVEIFRKDVYAFSEIPARVDPSLDVFITVLTVAFAVLICTWPAVRAGRLDPVAALRHE